MTPAQIVTLRQALGLSQAEFAQLFGVHQMTVSKWERGRQAPLAIPTPYQTALMQAFGRAAQAKRADVQHEVKNILVGAGVIAALFFLLSQARK
jgi:transcriptional regulator with XRE-family HTH domain